jgi:hypothetical protein
MTQATDGDIQEIQATLTMVVAKLEKIDYEFKASQSTGERLERLATSLIAGATISIIAGVILLLLREAR